MDGPRDLGGRGGGEGMEVQRDFGGGGRTSVNPKQSAIQKNSTILTMYATTGQRFFLSGPL